MCLVRRSVRNLGMPQSAVTELMDVEISVRERTVTKAAVRDVESAEQPPERTGGLHPMRPTTLAERIVEAIVRAAAEAHFLPGDKLVETDIARSLNVSRIPVREALRILESQGIAVNEPYKGMRLMHVDQNRIRQLLAVRTALEQLAAHEALPILRADPGAATGMETALAAMRHAVQDDDHYTMANQDTCFHRALCKLAGNQVLIQAWEPLSRQLTIIFGLSALQRPLPKILSEHEKLLATLKRGKPEEIDRALEFHLVDMNNEVDFEKVIAQRRKSIAEE